jgi:hypothetical protein
VCDGLENGFEGFEVLVANGFAEIEPEDGFEPKSVSPMFIAGFDAGDSTLGACFPFLFLDTSDILVPRNTFTLPSLRLQVFLRHVNT